MRQHQWFLHKLPAYLALPPEMIELQERHMDQEIVLKGEIITFLSTYLSVYLSTYLSIYLSIYLPISHDERMPALLLSIARVSVTLTHHRSFLSVPLSVPATHQGSDCRGRVRSSGAEQNQQWSHVRHDARTESSVRTPSRC